ncbi:hypothetical protein B0G76_5283 [Paraburkholderia sp. BL23I1N1]|nr:hypothetical protein B0G76_5283 [Paraburkholderia sp. BL23I1N1]
MPMAAPARAPKISCAWLVTYKRPNGRVSGWSDLRTFNAAPLNFLSQASTGTIRSLVTRAVQGTGANRLLGCALRNLAGRGEHHR